MTISLEKRLSGGTERFCLDTHTWASLGVAVGRRIGKLSFVQVPSLFHFVLVVVVLLNESEQLREGILIDIIM